MNQETKCQNLVNLFDQVSKKRRDFSDAFSHGDFSKAKSIKLEINDSIEKIGQLTQRTIDILGKEFPVFTLEIGGKASRELLDEFSKRGIQINNTANHILHDSSFVGLKEREKIHLVKLTIGDMGIAGTASTREIFGTINDTDEDGKPAPFTKSVMARLGLELCPFEVAVYQRLSDTEQPRNDYYCIPTKAPFFSSMSTMCVFGIRNMSNSLQFAADWINAVYEWANNEEIILQLSPER